LSGNGKVAFTDDSNQKADARLKQVIDAINNKDGETFKNMFSKQALSGADDFDGNWNVLLSYIQGNIQSWKSTGAYGGGETIDGNNHTKETDSFYIVTTTNSQEYRIAIYETTVDTVHPDNVGIYSFCIINSKDYSDSEHDYGGDRRLGISIGRMQFIGDAIAQKSDAHLEQVMNAINNKDEEAFKNMFSKQALSEDDNFDGNWNALLNYIQGNLRWTSTGAYGDGKDINAEKKEVDTTCTAMGDEEYRITVYAVTSDAANPDNIGIYSFCIIRSNDDPYPGVIYWGDSKTGINIGLK